MSEGNDVLNSFSEWTSLEIKELNSTFVLHSGRLLSDLVFKALKIFLPHRENLLHISWNFLLEIIMVKEHDVVVA